MLQIRSSLRFTFDRFNINMITTIQSHAKGFSISILIAIVAHFGAPFIPGFNSVLLALVIGIIIGNATKLGSDFKSGIDFSSSKLLEFSIVLLAFGLNLDQINSLGYKTVLLIILMIVIMLFATTFLSKRTRCPKSSGLMVGFGTTICGSSAIAAVAPSVAKDKQDIGISLAVVNLIGAIFMILWPFAQDFLQLNAQQIALLIGGTLHSVGNVAGAGFAINEEVGNLAVTIKMVRVAMLAPAVLLFSFITRESKITSVKEFLKLPLYLWAFIAVTLLVIFVALPTPLLDALETIAKWALATAMAAIGLKTSFKTLYSSGKRAVTFGFLIYGVQLLIIILGMMALA